MSKYFMVSYSPGATWTAYNKIGEAFNRSARVERWNAPHKGVFLVRSPEGTSSSDLRDIVLASARTPCFVTEVDLDKYSYAPAVDAAQDTRTWLMQNNKL